MLKFEDWLKLSTKERGERYKELSDKDKFKVRMGEYYGEILEKNDDFEPEIPEFLKDKETDVSTQE